MERHLDVDIGNIKRERFAAVPLNPKFALAFKLATVGTTRLRCHRSAGY